MHHISIYDYLISIGYIDVTEIKKCALCDNECHWNKIDWDVDTKTFVKVYDS